VATLRAATTVTNVSTKTPNDRGRITSALLMRPMPNSAAIPSVMITTATFNVPPLLKSFGKTIVSGERRPDALAAAIHKIVR